MLSNVGECAGATPAEKLLRTEQYNNCADVSCLLGEEAYAICMLPGCPVSKKPYTLNPKP